MQTQAETIQDFPDGLGQMDRTMDSFSLKAIGVPQHINRENPAHRSRPRTITHWASGSEDVAAPDREWNERVAICLPHSPTQLPTIRLRGEYIERG